jgi:AraC-like DNA-binding protein
MPDRFSVTARFTHGVIAAARRQGVAIALPLEQALAEGRRRVGAQQQDELWSTLCAGATDPLLALTLGADMQAGHLDIVGLLLLSCDTLGDGLEVLTEYAPIIGDMARFETSSQGDSVTLQYLPEYSVCRAQRVEAALGCVVSLARWMTNGRFRPTELAFVHAPLAAPERYENILQCPVRFGADSNCVTMAASELQHGLIQAGSELHAQLRQLADDMLGSLQQGGVSARVQQLIREHPRWGKERIGEQLGMSGRHLNRKLAAEAISFKGLREALLYDLAVKALRQGETTVAVSVRLGFSDESAFARAFRRWSGQTPAQFARSGPPAAARQPPTMG